MSVDFQEAYLKEIGVQTPISSFLQPNQAEMQQNQAIPDCLPPKQPSLHSAEPSPSNLLPAHTHPLHSQQAVSRVSEVESMPKLDYSQVASTATSHNTEHQAGALEVAEPAVKMSTESKTKPVNIASDAADFNALKEQAQTCQACELASSRNQVVFGRGADDADLVFIGDSPNRDDDIEGQPFVGQSGALFDAMLASIALNDEQVYMLNGVKCRPQHGRDPKPEEFIACEQFLVRQLDFIQPKLICLLGRVVAQSLLKSDASLTELREGQFSFRGIPVLVIDHPSYLLRSQKNKKRAWQDLNRLKIRLQKLQSNP